MDAPRFAAATIAVLALASCTSRPQPKEMPPQAVTNQTPEPPPPSDPPPPVPAKPSTVVVVDQGATDEAPAPTLAEAARAERERRRSAGKPSVVITDKNLAEYAAKGQITTAKPTPPPPPTAAEAAAVQSAKDEAYWRNRGLEIRQRWHDAADAVKKEQAAVERLRTQFYSEDDPYVRDGRIKPEWDRALEKLDQGRRDIETAKHDLDTFTDEGRRAGVAEAWLEEGIDLEPPKEPAKRDKPATDPGEPKILQEGSKEPPPGA